MVEVAINNDEMTKLRAAVAEREASVAERDKLIGSLRDRSFLHSAGSLGSSGRTRERAQPNLGEHTGPERTTTKSRRRCAASAGVVLIDHQHAMAATRGPPGLHEPELNR